MPGRRGRLLALLVAFQIVGPLVHPAELRAEPTAVEKETARALMADGREKRAAGDHKGALQAFQAAHAIMGVPTTGLEVGRSQAAVGLLVEARDTLLAVSRIPVKAGEPAAFAAARKQAIDLADEIAERIPAIRINLQGALPDHPPTVSIDGAVVAPASLLVAVKVNPGVHTVVARVDAAEAKITVTLQEGEEKPIALVVPKPTTKPEPASSGSVSPASSAAPSPSPSSSVTTTAPAAPMVATPVAAEPGRSPLVWIGFATAGVALVVGGVTGALELSKANAIKEQCEGTRCPRAVDGELSTARTLATVSTIGFAVAGAGAVLGVVGLFARPAPATTGTVGVYLGLGSIGVHGAF